MTIGGKTFSFYIIVIKKPVGILVSLVILQFFLNLFLDTNTPLSVLFETITFMIIIVVFIYLGRVAVKNFDMSMIQTMVAGGVTGLLFGIVSLIIFIINLSLAFIGKGEEIFPEFLKYSTFLIFEIFNIVIFSILLGSIIVTNVWLVHFLFRKISEFFKK